MKVLAQLAAIPALRTVERRGNYGVDPGAMADHNDDQVRFAHRDCCTARFANLA